MKNAEQTHEFGVPPLIETLNCIAWGISRKKQTDGHLEVTLGQTDTDMDKTWGVLKMGY